MLFSCFRSPANVRTIVGDYVEDGGAGGSAADGGLEGRISFFASLQMYDGERAGASRRCKDIENVHKFKFPSQRG